MQSPGVHSATTLVPTPDRKMLLWLRADAEQVPGTRASGETFFRGSSTVAARALG